jgi:hypothetical protein
MRPSHIWLLVTVFWTADAISGAYRKHWSAAVPAAVVAAMFCIVWLIYLRRERRVR